MIAVKKTANPRVTFAPSFYKQAMREYDNGQASKLMALMKGAAQDSYVIGCLGGRHAGFQREWNIEPYDNETEEDVKRAEWINGIFKQLDTRSLFKKIHEAALYIFSVIDFEWEVLDSKQVPTSFKYFDQKYFKYDKQGVLKIDFGKELREIPETTLVCESTETPVMLPVVKDYILKNFGVESWAAFIETFGEALIIGKYPTGTTNEQRDELEASLANIARSSRGTMKDDESIEIIETKRNTGDHEKFTNVCNRSISIALLGHANAVEDTSGMKIGENLGPFKVKRSKALDDIYFIQACWNKLIRIIYSRNYSDSRFPTSQIDKSEPINVGERLDVLDSAYDKGLPIKGNEYRKLGIEVDADQEDLVKSNPFEVV